jgi:hypothetical protein
MNERCESGMHLSKNQCKDDLLICPNNQQVFTLILSLVSETHDTYIG